MWEYRNGAASEDSEGQWYPSYAPPRRRRRQILLTPHNASLNREPLARSALFADRRRDGRGQGRDDHLHKLRVTSGLPLIAG